MKIMRSFTIVAVLALGATAVPQIGSAHHAATMFDYSKVMMLKGTLLELQWINPHAALLVSGTINGGQPTDWALEMSSPGNLVRAGGWTQTALKPGDRVT